MFWMLGGMHQVLALVQNRDNAWGTK